MGYLIWHEWFSGVIGFDFPACSARHNKILFFGGHPGPEYGFQRSRETRFYCSVQGMYLCLHVSSQGRWDNYSLPAKYGSILNGELIAYAIMGLRTSSTRARSAGYLRRITFFNDVSSSMASSISRCLDKATGRKKCSNSLPDGWGVVRRCPLYKVSARWNFFLFCNDIDIIYL